MTKLLEIKDIVVRFFGKYESYLLPLLKCILAFLCFQTINSSIGYMERLKSLPVILILSLLCGVLPMNFTVGMSVLMILLHLYSLSLEVAITALALFLVLFLVYFRFTPKDGVMALITPLCFKLRIPYIMPIASGLLREIYSVAAVVCGTIVFYFLDGISQNAASLTAVEEESLISKSKFDVSVGQILQNKEMFLVAGVFVLSAIVVYLVRRLEVEHAWTIAIVAGALIQTAGMFVGYLVLAISYKAIWLLFGNILSLLLGFVLNFWCMNLDYERTERVQFEDDDYYYYVKAVPKKMVASKSVTVKHFSNTSVIGKTTGEGKTTRHKDEEEEANRKVIAKELDIDEDLLK